MLRSITRILRSRRHDERGQFLVMTLIFMTMFLALAGLVVDGGSYLNAKDAAATEAAQAARAGAGALDPNQLHAATLGIDPAQAVRAAENAMTAAGHPGTAWVIGNTVYAHISYDQTTQLLSIIGITSMHIDVTEQATNVAGVS
ncbi:MAG: TadE/TadG family type IV pilus assembly protein [Acidimicrobiales bacterium]|jgi:Flp pilus assembly protein TadG